MTGGRKNAATPGAAGFAGKTRRGTEWEARVVHIADEYQLGVELQLVRPGGDVAVSAALGSDEAAEIGYWLLSMARNASRLNRGLGDL